MAISEEEMRRLRDLKSKYEADLMRKANVVGVGIGFRHRRGRRTDQLALVVSVTHKVPISQLDAEDIVPRELDGVPVDIEAVGTLRAFNAGGE